MTRPQANPGTPDAFDMYGGGKETPTRNGGTNVTRLRMIVALAGLAAMAAGGTAMAAKPPKPGSPTLSITASSTHVVYGGAVTIRGRLTGTGSANAAVTVQQAPFPYTRYANLAAGRTSAFGTYSFGGLRPGLNTRYRARAKGVTSANTLVFVRYRVSLSVSDSTPARGQRVRFSGVVSPAASGRLLLLQRRGSDGVFRTVGRTTLLPRTATSSQFRLTKRIFSTGTYRAHIGADAAHEPGNSGTRRLRVHS
jgi:hypothetical protein